MICCCCCCCCVGGLLRDSFSHNCHSARVGSLLVAGPACVRCARSGSVLLVFQTAIPASKAAGASLLWAGLTGPAGVRCARSGSALLRYSLPSPQAGSGGAGGLAGMRCARSGTPWLRPRHPREASIAWLRGLSRGGPSAGASSRSFVSKVFHPSVSSLRSYVY